jgi:hypothetical protein
MGIAAMIFFSGRNERRPEYCDEKFLPHRLTEPA